MKKLLIPTFCLFHMVAIFWWTVPYSIGRMILIDNEHSPIVAKLLKEIMLDDYPNVSALLKKYIDATGSQQYWDFFASPNPRLHQYLSVCGSVIAYPDQGTMACKDKPLFTNLDTNFERFGSGRSRLYRLTENLTKLEEPVLLEAFTQYYLQHRGKSADSPSAQLVLHQFELHPGLKDLPRIGYRMDKVIWVSN